MITRILFTGCVALALLIVAPVFPGISAGQARADVTDSEVLFRRKAWEVSFVSFDDGTYACLAQVGNTTDSFLIWAYSNNEARLQFYSTAWHFDNETADIALRIDRRPLWTLTNAQLNQNSVFFNLTDEKTSLKFLREVMRGNVLNLLTEGGKLIERYSLSGSSASIVALSECVGALDSAGGDANPFD